jgi:predicted TPR repeat methyltransferase
LQKDSGKLNEAEITCRKAMEMIPGNSELHFNLAAIFQTQGKLEEAKSLYLSTITLDPNNVEANKNLGTILNRLGNPKESGQFYRRALEINPNYEEVKHLLSAVSGGKTSAAPRQYVETLFDDYSETFEKVLTVDLEYTAPHQIAELLCSNQNKIENLSVLDLGCGTGLVGNEIKKMCSYLVGVDVSNSMLNKAKKKAIYDDLIYGDITDYLKATNLNFDYFIASDVFVYIGDLSQIFYAIKSRNIKPGKLVFSTEHTEGDGFSLEESGRYAHSKKYIQDLCSRFDYQLSFFETIPLRKNESSWISGGLYVLDF